MGGQCTTAAHADEGESACATGSVLLVLNEFLELLLVLFELSHLLGRQLMSCRQRIAPLLQVLTQLIDLLSQLLLLLLSHYPILLTATTTTGSSSDATLAAETRRRGGTRRFPRRCRHCSDSRGRHSGR
jgi:hypothetical protein